MQKVEGSSPFIRSFESPRKSGAFLVFLHLGIARRVDRYRGSVLSWAYRAGVIHCALNGGYGHEDHPEVPVTLRELVEDALACRAAGASLVHVHPRRLSDGLESLAAVTHDAVVSAIRQAVPDVEISCSTQQDIDLGGLPDRITAVRAWKHPPDVVSLNLCEPGSIELGSALVECGIGIEAGVFTPQDADALLAAPWAHAVTRVLVEVIFEHEDASAVELARAIDARVAVLGRPRVWHGDGRATWAVVDAGLYAGVDVRVGLEDALVGRDGGAAPGNAIQVARTLARAA
jgi:uncharacterized protein (DUF849 family)